MQLVPRSIRSRIVTLFLLAVSAFIGAMGYGLSQLQTIGQGLTALDQCYLPLTQAGTELEAVIQQMERDDERFDRDSLRPMAGVRSNTVLYRSAIDEITARGTAIIEISQPLLQSSDDPIALNALGGFLLDIDGALGEHERAFDAWLSATEDSSGAALAELRRRQTEIRRPVGQFNALISERIETVSTRTANARERAYGISVALAVLAIIFAGVLTKFALVTLTPIASLIKQVQRLAAGDYTGEALPEPTGVGEEVALLAREFNGMAEAVGERDRRLSERAAALDQLSLRLRQILDTINAGLLVIDDGQIELCNPAATQMWNIKPNSTLPEWLELAPGRHERLSVAGILYDINVVPFGATGALIVGEDVTSRVEVQERLARAERLALVGQMLAQITHEVRNPLNAMSLNAELLAEELENHESREMLVTITDEIRRLETLTARYLALSRRRTPESAPEDPANIVQEIIRIEEPALKKAGVQVTLNKPDHIIVEIDGSAIRRALRNILLNAVESGAKAIGVNVIVTKSDLVIEVSDNGPGMTQAQINKAFEPFFTTKAKGTGLGLAISRQELEEVGGKIHCKSSRNNGTTFSIKCPIKSPPPAMS